METVNYDHISDEDLVLRIINGHSQEFSLLYDRYASKVYYKCLSFAKDPSTAQDLTHDIFIKTFIHLPQFTFKSLFSTWLYSIAYHYCIDFVKQINKVRLENDEEMLDIPDSDDSKNEEVLMKIDTKELIYILDQLHPSNKAILLMKYQDELSIKEIQEILELTESAVKMRIKRARAKAIEQYHKYLKS